MNAESSHGSAPPSAILETCLDVADLPRARAFYTGLFGYPVIAEDDRFCAMSIAGPQVLLLFLRTPEWKDIDLPFGTIPYHGSTGPAHIGFSIPAESLPAWRERLAQFGIPIQSSFTWPRGGVSIYFRDPDDHLVELLTPGVWSTY